MKLSNKEVIKCHHCGMEADLSIRLMPDRKTYEVKCAHCKAMTARYAKKYLAVKAFAAAPGWVPCVDANQTASEGPQNRLQGRGKG